MNRNYVIFNVSELASIDFSQVLETSADTVRKSIDETLTFVKYEGEMPSTVTALTTKQGPYTHSEILTILAGPDWTDPNPPME
jgi:hypothetical protein